MVHILKAVQIRKEISGYPILQNISFACSNNTVLLVRGKNGSGKSTLLKILAGIIEPTSGKVISSAKKIGYVPEHFPEHLRFRLQEYLLLTASFHGLTGESVHRELSKYINLFGLEPFLRTPLTSCSKGTRQKVGIIQALLIRPDLLLLDEPLTGLDIESQQILIQLLKEEQVPIIFTSHEAELIDRLALEILQVETGELTINKGNVKPKRSIRVEFQRKEDLKDIPASNTQYEGNIAVLTVDKDSSDQVLRSLLGKNCSILEVKEQR